MDVAVDVLVDDAFPLNRPAAIISWCLTPYGNLFPRTATTPHAANPTTSKRQEDIVHVYVHGHVHVKDSRSLATNRERHPSP